MPKTTSFRGRVLARSPKGAGALRGCAAPSARVCPRRGGDQYPIPAYSSTGRGCSLRRVEGALLALPPASAGLVAAFEDESRRTWEQGTIRFPLSRPVPVKLIERIAGFRAKEAAARAAKKKPSSRPRAAARKRQV